MITFVSAEKRADRDMPTRTILVVLIFAPLLPKTKTRIDVRSAPKKAPSASGSCPIKGIFPIRSDSTAPVEAPDEIPRIYGSARGFLVSACIMIPASASPAPVKPATRTLGNRSFHTMLI